MIFDEMSVTLDVVSCLIHLPIRGLLWIPRDVIEEDVVAFVVDFLEELFSEATPHVCFYVCAYYKLEWTHELFTHH